MPAPAPPPLRPWSRVWRYLVVISVGLATWVAVTVDLMPQDEQAPDDVVGPLGAAIMLDLVLGVIGVALLPLRRRYPTAIASVTGALSAFSGAAVGAAALSAVSMSTHRRWRGVIVTGAAWLVAAIIYEGLYRPSLPGIETSTGYFVLAGSLALVAYAACVSTGFYIGARRELLETLRERAETAEREQSLKADAAREAERTRIAREMHDVLAHRISLVAMHAGALAYRTDLTPAETTQTATIIQDNAHSALAELRQVLGVLRADSGTGSAGTGPARAGLGGAGAHDPGPPEPPQPSLRELPALLAENAEAGTVVDLDLRGLAQGDVDPLALPPPTLSRTAFRIVQEVLTNARKHAPGAAVSLSLAGAPGDDLRLRASNQVPEHTPAGPPGAGMGLTGLEERAALAGGVLEHGVDAAGRFVVTAALPWSAP
ncbi:two-component sensor histidine kinase [Actinotalea sp. BY-33]|uniref:histidine kinase n=1 Tax=Actinotalea soli TaxID=2819234 RepID=A0A939LPC7_9CELL|nr:histidine kinase [Actinotalea soli]MBO1751393.1 two-component sensor histidine kinase [Actinotalea soli]